MTVFHSLSPHSHHQSRKLICNVCSEEKVCKMQTQSSHHFQEFNFRHLGYESEGWKFILDHLRSYKATWSCFQRLELCRKMVHSVWIFSKNVSYFIQFYAFSLNFFDTHYGKNQLFVQKLLRIWCLKIWILWKMRFWNCEFCERWDFKNVNFVKSGILKLWILSKSEILKMEISPKIRFLKMWILRKLIF